MEKDDTAKELARSRLVVTSALPNHSNNLPRQIETAQVRPASGQTVFPNPITDLHFLDGKQFVLLHLRHAQAKKH